MCGGLIGSALSSVTDAIGLTDTKKAAKGFDVLGAEAKAKNDAQMSANESIAQRKKRTASTVLSSATTDNQKKDTLGG